MKLHLPKLLCVAVMAAVSYQAQAVEAVIDVGLVDTTVASAAHSTITASTTDVTVGKDQAIGAFDENGNLITSFGAYTYDNDSSTITSGSGSVVSNNLEVEGTLTINDNGQVYLGGQIKIANSSKRDSYSGLIADTVVVNGDGTTTNLQIGTATIGTLTVNSGKVRIHKDGTSGGNGWAASVGTDCKTVTIKKAINVHDGLLDIGYESNAQSGSSHYQTHFNYNAKINQTGGTIKIAGQTSLNNGFQINQSSGTFDTPTTVNGQLAFELSSGSFSINQINPENGESANSTPSLTIRRLATKKASWQSKVKKLDITQTADKGIIDLTAGLAADNSTKFTLSETSTLKQDTVSGVINLSGDFSGATYNVEQSGTGTININSGCTFNINNLSVGSGSTLDVKGSVTVTGASTLSGIIKVADDATLTLDGATTLTGNSTLEGHMSINGALTVEDAAHVSVNSTLTLSEGNSMTFDIGSATPEQASMSMTENGNLELTSGSISLELTDVALQEMIDGATPEGTQYTLTLIDNISDTDMAELQAAIDAGTLTLEDYSYSTVSTYAMRSATPDVTIESTGLVLEGNALKATLTATTQSIPEPATATLSLLALAGLAARRRRK